MGEYATDVTAVTISKEKERLGIPLNYYCHTEDYEPILHHDNNDLNRIQYLTKRYNRGVEVALQEFSETKHLLIVDSYYLPFIREIQSLLETYLNLENSIVGASIWYWDRSHLRSSIFYYDHLSVKEFRNIRWHSLRQLPRGLLPVSGVGGCFVFPRKVWEESGGFSIPNPEPQAGGSRCLRTAGYRTLLDCDVKLWRTHANNSGIPDYSFVKRLRVSAGQFRRRIVSHKIVYRNC